jgi:aspartate-semialdehyde dehydrogenase
MEKLRSCILGATGAAGQNVVEAIVDHPWFEVEVLAASPRSEGKSYREAIEGAVFFEKPVEDRVLDMKVQNVDRIDPRNFDLAFSALPSDIARGLEARFAKQIPVFSTSSAYRYEDDVPVLIPDVNPEHVELVDFQRNNRGWKGYVCPGPNCTTVGLVTTLKPIHDSFGVESARMVSMQSLSGAGEKGLRKDSSYRKKIEMNVYPFIEGEEEKVVRETRKILGRLEGGKILDADVRVHATCTRVYVESVHTEVVDVEMSREASIVEIKDALRKYESEPQRLGLPSAPERPILVLEEIDMPQPILHRGKGFMVTLVGRLRANPLSSKGFTYILTSDNLEKGAGAGAVLTAELMKVRNYL